MRGDAGETMAAHKGDILVSINGRKVKELTKEEVDKLLNQQGERIIGVKRRMVSQRKLENYLIQQREILENCSALPFTVALLLIFVWLTVLHGQTQTSYYVTSSLKEDIASVTVGGYGKTYGLDDHQVPSDLFDWLSAGLVDKVCTMNGALAPTDPRYASVMETQKIPPGRLRTFNQVVGAVRIKRVKTDLKDCDYDLQEPYGMQCHGDPSALAFPNEDTAFIDIKVARPVMHFWFDELRQQNWMGDDTDMVDVEMVLVNAEVGLFIYVKINVEYRRAGSPLTRVDLRLLPTLVYPDVWHFIPDLLWLMLTFALFQQELKQVWGEMWEGRLMEYFGDVWNTIDWTSILLAVFIAFYWVFLLQKMDDVQAKAVNLPARVGGGMSDKHLYRQVRESEDFKKYATAFDNLIQSTTTVCEDIQFERLMMFWYTMVIVLRFFKGFRGQTRLAAMSIATWATLGDFLHFALIVATVFINFAFGGHIMFGAQLEEWSSPVRCVDSALGVLTGNFNFTEAYAIAPLTAAMWFWSYLLFLCFVVMNAIVAIIVRGYMDVKIKLGFIPETLTFDTNFFIEERMWRIQMGADIPLKESEEILNDVSEDPETARETGLIDLRLQSRRVRDLRASSDPVTVDGLQIDAEVPVDQGKFLLQHCKSRPEHLDPIDSLVDGHRKTFATVARELQNAKRLMLAWENACFQNMDRLLDRQLNVTNEFKKIVDAADTASDGSLIDRTTNTVKKSDMGTTQ